MSPYKFDLVVIRDHRSSVIKIPVSEISSQGTGSSERCKQDYQLGVAPAKLLSAFLICFM